MGWLLDFFFGLPPKGRGVVAEDLGWPLYWCLFDSKSGEILAAELRTLEDAEQYCILQGYKITKVIN